MDEQRTLNELDPPAFPPPSHNDPTNLIRRCNELRGTPLAEFDVEDLRIMIGQQISLRYLIPRAITVLEANPLAEGDMYPGDLLSAVLRADKSYWHANVEQWQDVEAIGRGLITAVEELRDSIEAFTTSTF
jgi:hypothetical protein